LVQEVWRGRYPAPGTGDTLFQGGAAMAWGFVNGQKLYIAGTKEISRGKFRVVVTRYAAESPGGANHAPELVVTWPDADELGILAKGIVTVDFPELGTQRVYVIAKVPGTSGDGDVMTFAFDEELKLLWTDRYDGPPGGHDTPVAIAANTDYVVVAATSTGNGGTTDIQTLIYDPNTGKLAVQKGFTRHATAGNDWAVDVILHGSSVFVLGGSPDGSGHHKCWTTEYRADLPAQPQQWALFSGVPNRHHWPADMFHHPTAGGLYITATYRPGTDHQVPGDWYTTKVFGGQHSWYNLPAADGFGMRFDSGMDDQVAALAVERTVGFTPYKTNVYVTGYSRSATSGSDIFTIRYEDQVDRAAEMWTARLNDVPNSQNEYFGGPDGATAINAWTRLVGNDVRNEVYVTGYRTSQFGTFDYVTVKYDHVVPAPVGNKTPRWGIFYPLSQSTPSLNDIPWAQHLPIGYLSDGYKNLFVTGQSDGGSSGYDMLTIRYRDRDDQ
jgi:hypothetical protein